MKQFRDTVEEMRTIYPFEDDKTHICELYDLITNEIRCVEIMTLDKRTNTRIIMSKEVRGFDNGK